MVYEARLLADDELHWSDGDVWARTTPSYVEFDGEWGPASIRNGTLTWSEGEDVAIVVTSRKTFRMDYVGKVYTAKLLDNGKLQWSDGDLWERQCDRSEIPCWRPAREAAKVECLEPGESVPRAQASFSRSGKEDESLEPRGSGPRLRPSCSRSCKQSFAAESSASKPQKQYADFPSAQKPSSSHPGSADAQARPLRGRCQVVSEPLSEARFDGTVKYFRGSFGWVSSAYLQRHYGGRDAFLHINDCSSGFQPRQGDAVTFVLAEDQMGNPKAVRAQAPVVTNARDWFQKRERDLASRR